LLVERPEQTRDRPAPQPPLRWRSFRVVDGHHVPTRFGTLVSDALHAGGPPWGAQVPAASHPVTPVRPQLTLGGGVGAARPNAAADVRAVQDRLLELRYLAADDHTAERLAGEDAVTPASLPRTIAAIRAIQTEHLGAAAADGAIDAGGGTLGVLNRAIPRPTAAEYTAVATDRAAVTETITRGVALVGRVGNVTAAEVAAGTANRPADVRAVQQRLVAIGMLAADHGEAPAAGATASIPDSQLTATRAAIRRFQRDVAFWRREGFVTALSTDEVVAPNDGTHQLLAAIGTYVEAFPDGQTVTFARDHPTSQYTEHRLGASYAGTAAPANLPAAEWGRFGLTPAQTRALQFVSEHEGNFDAINTYDSQRISFGFIQFAGSFGLPPFLALLKSREPAAFQARFQQFGIDIEFNVVDGNVSNPRIVALDPGTTSVRRGTAATSLIRDTPRLWAVFVRAGHDVAVQRVQVEAAARDYLFPSLATEATYETEVVDVLTAPGGEVETRRAGWLARQFRQTPDFAALDAAGRIDRHTDQSGVNVGHLFASEQGLAVLLDRAVQEGAGAGAGVARVLGAVRWVCDREGLADIVAANAHERAVLAQVVGDFTADIEIAGRIDAAAGAIDRLRTLAGTAGTTVADLLGHADLVQARRSVDRAIAAVPQKSYIHPVPSPRWIRRTALESGLPPARTALDLSPAPADAAAASTALAAVAASLRALRPPEADSTLMRDRRVARIIAADSPLRPPP
jgi:hypothetical protein